MGMFYLSCQHPLRLSSLISPQLCNTQALCGKAFLWKQRFNYEDLHTTMLLGDYLFCFDLKSGYHHVDIAPEHCKYLGFAWGEGEQRRFHEFTVLPFGLSTACYLLLRPLVKYWQARGPCAGLFR